ncbi:CapA family protein [Paenibacillus sp. CN-4]|uniref:CapA family protein n=1 Tax=Paenibacillus nanchangensis TaxID=3348343 RepID=UPI003979B80B
MYPPRSKRNKTRKTARSRKFRTTLAWVNASLLLAITIVIAYSFMRDKESAPLADGGGAALPETPAAAGTPSPAGTPGAQGTPQPGAAAEPTAAASQAAQDAVPGPGSTASPAADPTAALTAAPSAAPSAPAAEVSPSPPAASGGDNSSPVPGAAGGTGGAEAPAPSAGLPAGGAGATVTMNFAGDTMFAGKVGTLLAEKGYAYPYARLGGLFQQDDLTVLNLETSVTTRGSRAADKQFVFKSPPEALKPMKAAGVDAVNLANNHTLDQGVVGLTDTLEHLQNAGIPYVGAGLNSTEAYSAQYFDRGGIKIALLGFTRVMPVMEWKAGMDTPGLASVYDSAEGLRAIAEARQKADLVVVVVHWGKERKGQYDEIQQSLGRSFIDAGADLVIGGHPHVLQGIEPYKGKWIAYSNGNFIFTRSATAATWETAVFQAQCNANGQCGLKVLPYHAELGQPVPMNAEDGAKLLKKVEGLSGGRVTIGPDGKVTQAR